MRSTRASVAYPTEGTRAAVSLRGVTRAFDDGPVLSDLDLDIAPGEFVALLGRSGSGKTTLLRAIAGLDREVTGEVAVSAPAAVVFQTPRLLPWSKVWRNVLLGLPDQKQRQLALDALREVGVEHRADVWPRTLSGGEAQRVALARALVRSPGVLLLDEPFAALDALTRLTARQLVERLWQQHRPAVLLVTHDVEEAIACADRVLVLEHGRLVIDRRVELPRPHNPEDPRFGALRRDLLTALGISFGEAA